MLNSGQCAHLHHSISFISMQQSGASCQIEVAVCQVYLTEQSASYDERAQTTELKGCMRTKCMCIWKAREVM